MSHESVFENPILGGFMGLFTYSSKNLYLAFLSFAGSIFCIWLPLVFQLATGLVMLK